MFCAEKECFFLRGRCLLWLSIEAGRRVDVTASFFFFFPLQRKREKEGKLVMQNKREERGKVWPSDHASINAFSSKLRPAGIALINRFFLPFFFFFFFPLFLFSPFPLFPFLFHLPLSLSLSLFTCSCFLFIVCFSSD